MFGSILSTGIGFLIEFLCFNLDYSRTEKVQFEDDEYYYYVKAVPKVNLSSKEKQIKKISGKKNAKRSGGTDYEKAARQRAGYSGRYVRLRID